MSHLLECASSPNLVYTTQNDRNVRNSSRSNRQPIQKLQELKSIVEKAIEVRQTLASFNYSSFFKSLKIKLSTIVKMNIENIIKKVK